MNETDEAVTIPRELGEWLLGMAERGHVGCDVSNDAECRAEQYGDGTSEDHMMIRIARGWLA